MSTDWQGMGCGEERAGGRAGGAGRFQAFHGVACLPLAPFASGALTAAAAAAAAARWGGVSRRPAAAAAKWKPDGAERAERGACGRGLPGQNKARDSELRSGAIRPASHFMSGDALIAAASNGQGHVFRGCH